MRMTHMGISCTRRTAFMRKVRRRGGIGAVCVWGGWVWHTGKGV